MNTIRLSITFFTALVLLVLPYHFLHAAYEPFVSIPGFAYGDDDFVGLVNTIYKILISIGAIFGVIKIAFAGVKYTMSDMVSTKQSAKDDIVGVLIGLTLLLIPFLVLNTIYSNLTNLDVFGVGFGEPGTIGTEAKRLPALEEGQIRVACYIDTDRAWYRFDGNTYDDCKKELNCGEDSVVPGPNRSTIKVSGRHGTLAQDGPNTLTCTYSPAKDAFTSMTWDIPSEGVHQDAWNKCKRLGVNATFSTETVDGVAKFTCHYVKK